MSRLALSLVLVAALAVTVQHVAAASPQPLFGQSTVIFANNSRVVPGGSELYAYDFATSKLTMISNQITGAPSFLSSSIVCGDYYHGVDVNPATAMGIGSVNLKTGEYHFAKTTTLYHALHCTKTPGMLSAISSNTHVPDSPDGLYFASVIVNATDGTSKFLSVLNTASLAWRGSDAAFSFSKDGSEVWAAFATSLKSQTGVLLVIDTATGAQKASYNFPASKGWPYGVIASTKVALLMTGKYTTGNVFWYDMSLSGNSISVTGGQAVKWIYNGGAPPAICGDVGFANQDPPYYADDDTAPPAGKKQTITMFNTKTGDIIQTVDINTLVSWSDVAGVACGMQQ